MFDTSPPKAVFPRAIVDNTGNRQCTKAGVILKSGPADRIWPSEIRRLVKRVSVSMMRCWAMVFYVCNRQGAVLDMSSKLARQYDSHNYAWF